MSIAALSETFLTESGSVINNGYTFFWSGGPKTLKRECVVGVAIKNLIVQNLEQDPSSKSDPIMIMRLPLQD